MTATPHRRPRRLATWGVACLLLLAGGLPGTPAHAADDRPPAYVTLAECLGRTDVQPVLLTMVVVDESGSIRDTDPDDVRVAGVKALTSAIAQLGVANELPVELRIATFADAYAPLTPDPADADPVWQRVTVGDVDALIDRADLLAERDSGPSTDYATALDRARTELATRAGSLDQGQVACKLLVFLTDGELDLMDPAAEAAAAERLCAAGGITDQLRSDRVVTVTVGLSTGLDSAALGFLEAVAVGSSATDTCGSTGSPASGLFITADDADELLRALGTVLSTPYLRLFCPVPGEPACTFDVPSGFTGFRLLGTTPPTTDGTLVDATLQLPSGTNVPLPTPGTARDTIDLGSTTATVRWFGPRQFEVVTDTVSDLSGRWALAFVADADAEFTEPGNIDVTLSADLRAAFVDVPDALVTGETTPLRATLLDGDGRPLPPGGLLDQASFAAALVGEDGELTGVPTTRDGDTWRVDVAVPDGATEAVTLSVSASVPTPDGTDVQVAASQVTIPVRPVFGVAVTPSELELSPVRGLAPSTGELRIVGPEASTACVRLVGSAVQLPSPASDDPPVTAAPTIEVEGFPAGADAGCTEVGPGEELVVPVSVTPNVESLGTANGRLELVATGEVAGEEQQVTVPLRFDLRPARNTGIAVGWFLLFLAIGVGVPVWVLHWTARRGSLLGPPNLLRYGRWTVEHSPSRGLVSLDRRSFPPEFEDLELFPVSGRAVAKETVRVGSITFERDFGSFPAGWFATLFRGAWAVARDNGRPVASGTVHKPLPSRDDGRAGVVEHALAGTWTFVLHRVDQDTGDELTPGSGEARLVGELLVVVSEGGHVVDDSRALVRAADALLGDVAARLRATTPRVSQTPVSSRGTRTSVAPPPVVPTDLDTDLDLTDTPGLRDAQPRRGAPRTPDIGGTPPPDLDDDRRSRDDGPPDYGDLDV